VFLVHLPNGFFMNWFGTQKGEGFEYHLLALGLALIVILRGGGKWSLDEIIGENSCRPGILQDAKAGGYSLASYLCGSGREEWREIFK
jgi:hypothetical protein